MFILELNDFSAISRSNDPSSVDYNPIFFLLDSTPIEISPSSSAELLASLPSGYYSDGATVTMSGSSSNFWEFSLDNPALVTTPIWNSEVNFVISNNARVSLWVRANTVNGEIPKDDRESSTNIYGEVGAV